MARPQLEHPMVAHQSRKPDLTSAPELKVHTVMPAEDEETAFNRQMAASEAVFEPFLKNPAPTDAILDREMKKRETFSKLVLLKEDHTTEVSVAGLVFKLKLLNSIDNNFVVKEARKEPTEDQLASLQLLVLAASVLEVNGVRFEEFYSGPLGVDHPVLKKYFELRQWQRPVISVLQKAYGDFQASVEKELTKDFLVK